MAFLLKGLGSTLLAFITSGLSGKEGSGNGARARRPRIAVLGARKGLPKGRPCLSAAATILRTAGVATTLPDSVLGGGETKGLTNCLFGAAAGPP